MNTFNYQLKAGKRIDQGLANDFKFRQNNFDCSAHPDKVDGDDYRRIGELVDVPLYGPIHTWKVMKSGQLLLLSLVIPVRRFFRVASNIVSRTNLTSIKGTTNMVRDYWL